MKVAVFPADAHGCGHYRLIWSSNVLQMQGVTIFIIPPNKNTGFKVKLDANGKLIELVAPEVDVVVLQRPAHELQLQLIPALRRAGIAVVVDMDDDMSSVHQDNVAFHHYRTATKNNFSWRNASEACKLATLVTTSTAQLQRVYAKHGRGIVLDNYVPEAYLDVENTAEPGFGWAGTTASHPDDLQATKGAVRKLADDGHAFRVVGPTAKVKAYLGLQADPEATGYVGLEDWVKTMAKTYQVGMVPLSPSSFNTSKSRLKGIEHMSVGVPWVASPRAEYRRLHQESGCGFLADTAKEWYTHVKRLLTDDVLRKEQSEMGREYMKTQTYQANAWRWLDAWNEAIRIQRG